MIVPMKRILLLCVEKDTESTLAAMRDLGAVHLDLSSSGGEEKAVAGSALDKAEKAIRIAAKAAKEFGDGKTGESLGADEILALEARREELKGTAVMRSRCLRRIVRSQRRDSISVTALTASSTHAGVAHASISFTSVSMDSNTGMATPATFAVPVFIDLTFTNPDRISSPPAAKRPTHEPRSARAFSSRAVTSSAFCTMPAISA